jgi:argininosuccinate synthase
MKKKVVLAYSGDLDTTVIIPWLKENQDCDVIAVCVDVGQQADWKAIQKRAVAAGAASFFLVDAKKEYIEEFMWPILRAGAVYENKHHLGTSAAKALIAKVLVEYARKEKAAAVAHGASVKGNGQIRLELCISALAPELEIIAPWRVWKIKTREEGIRYLTRRKLPVPVTKKFSYSIDENLMFVSHKGLDLEDPKSEPLYKKILSRTVMPEKAPNTPCYIEIEFDKGSPVSLNGKKMEGAALINQLNKVGGLNGVGISDLTENNINGTKTRIVYEAPGASILYYAHNELEQLCLDRHTYSFKQILSLRTAALIYAGSWFTPLREALFAFSDSTQKTVSGKVRLKLYKGSINTAGTTSVYSLLKAEIPAKTKEKSNLRSGTEKKGKRKK